MNWEGYEPYAPRHLGPFEDLTRRQAREEFAHLMDAAPGRVRALERLLEQNGLQLGSEDDDLEALQVWLEHGAVLNDRGVLDSWWYCVVVDVALFLGSVTIRRCPPDTVHWALCTRPKSDPAYHKHVLTGFSTGVLVGIDVDLEGFVVAVALKAAGGKPRWSNTFVTEVNRCVACA